MFFMFLQQDLQLTNGTKLLESFHQISEKENCSVLFTNLRETFRGNDELNSNVSSTFNTKMTKFMSIYYRLISTIHRQAIYK